MKKVLVTLAPGFEEIETITVIDILRRAGARVTVAGTEEGAHQGSRGVSIIPDALLERVKDDDFDLIVLPGGQPGTDNLNKNSTVKAILKKMDQDHKRIGAICAAPMILNSAGLLKNRTVTSHPSVKDALSGLNYSEERVVVDGNIITSRSPGTALEFALKLVELLFGEEMRDKVNKGVLAKI
ncbi:MAG: DJ-1 family glyoxalase III [Nitrospinales bacterium]